MFVRTATRRNKDGSAVRYVQLVQNEWDPATKSSRMRVVHSFGREDQLDRAAVERLAGSLGRLLGPGRDAAPGAVPELAYAGPVAYGGTYLLDQLWGRLAIGQLVTAMLGPRPAYRGSGAGGAAGAQENRAGDQGGGDGPAMAGFRAFGKSKDHRDDLPQIVIGMAVTRSGIPVRVWCWPGNTADSALIRQVKHDMRDWTLSKIVWVADRGFTSRANRRYLRRGDHHYIIGEKLRSGSAEATASLSRQGRYQEIAGNLRVKQARISEEERFAISHNPEAAERAAPIRARLRAHLHERPA